MIKARLVNALGKVLGASWGSPLIVTERKTGGGDYHSPVDFTSTISGDSEVTLSGISPTVTDGSQFKSVRAYSRAGVLTGEWYPSSRNPFFYDSVNSTLEVVGASFGDAAHVDVELFGSHRSYSSTEDAYQNYIVNPEHAWTQQSTLVDDTNITDAAAVYYYVDFDMYRYGGFQIDLDCDAGTVTVTLEASFQDDGTAQASCAYQDVTNDLFGVASLVAAAGTAADTWVIDTPFPAKYLRIKAVYATGGNTGDATIYFRGTY